MACLRQVLKISVTIPTTGHADTDIYYKVYVVVTDAGGLTDTAFVNLLPTLKNITLKTIPSGLTVKLDDEPVLTPATQKSVVGVNRTIDVVSPQSFQGKVYSFIGWSHGGSTNQTYNTANRDTTFTALFQETQVTKDSISPIHDAFVQYTSYDGTNANIAYGATTPNDLVVKNYSPTPNRQTYIMFNLNNLLGSVADISSVKLKLYGGLTAETDVSNIKVIAYEGVNNSWTENAITWNTKPDKLTVKYDSINVTNLSPADQYYYLDLTTLIKAKVAAGENLVTVVLVTPNDNAKRVVFQSKENPGGKAPQLVVSYAANCNAVITSPTTTFCAGTSVTLSSNSGAGFTYKWYKDAVLIPGATSSTYSATIAGSYTVQVTNASACSKVSTAVLITQNSAPIATITSPVTTFCSGDSVLITANAGTGLLYSWYKNNSVIAGATAATYKAKAAGAYTVEVTGTNTCKKISTAITLTENTLPVANITSAATALCVGDSIVLTANSGTGLAYKWFKNAALIAGATASTYKAKTLGDYTIEVSNTNACKKLSNVISITENALPAATITSPVTAFCTGDSILLSANTGTGITYNWYKSSVLITGATSSTYKGKTAGTYTVEVSNANACKKISNAITLSENSLPVSTITSPATVFCRGDSILLTANTGSGLSYKWLKNTAVITGATASTYKGKTAGVYTVEVSNTNACKKVSNGISLVENPLPISVITAPSLAICTGDSVLLTANSGTGLQYKWSKNATLITGATTIAYKVKAAGTYTVEVSNSNGCKLLSAAVAIQENPLPVATVTSPTLAMCTGDSILLSANSGSGLTFKWFKNSVLIPAATSQTYKAKAAGAYYVEVSNTNTCKNNSSSINITENSLPAVTLTAPITAFCSGGNVLLTSSTGSTYQWILGSSPIDGATGSSYSASVGGSYTVEIMNVNGCKTISSPVLLVENPLPVATISVVSKTFCSGSSVVLFSSVAKSYQWYKGSSPINGATNSSYSSSVEGIYSVELTSNENCSNHSENVTLSIVTSVVWYSDMDADGVGNEQETISSCTQPNGYVSIAGDLCPQDVNKTLPGNCGCGNTEQSCLPTDIDSKVNTSSFVLYPNPVKQANLYFSKTISGSVYDAKGSLVLVFTNVDFLETSALEDGLYVIQTITGDSYKFYITR